MKYDKICLYVPTYKRPAYLGNFIDTALHTADDKENLLFSFCVNELDLETRSYLSGRNWPCKYEIILEKTEQPNLALYFNMIYEQTQFREPSTVVSMVGDDMVFLSDRWDTRILEEVNKADGKAVVYLNDNYIAGEKLCVNLFTTRAMIDPTGIPFMCPRFHAEMIDVVWYITGKYTGTLKYLGDLVLQHNHESKKDEKDADETYKRLSPLRNIANSKENQRIAVAYATNFAAKLIDKGVGKWNVL